MTAEIGVMNRIGIALAADSAVTIGGDSQKVYSSADKLFQLSEAAPVGIMVYGSADFTGLPWETLVKAFRRELASKTLPLLTDYVDAFMKFLARPAPLFTPQREGEVVGRLCLAILYHLRDRLESEYNEEAEKRDGLTDEEVAEITSNCIADRCADISSRQLLHGFSDADIDDAKAAVEVSFLKIYDEVLGDLPVSDESKLSLQDALANALIRNYAAPYVSGLVFAGFGEDEFVPSIVNIEVEERVLGRPRQINRTVHSLQRGSGAVVPFAQRDAVESFLEGVEPTLRDEMKTSVSVLFSGAFDALTEELKKHDPAIAQQVEESLKPGLQDLLARLFTGWESMRRQHWRPVIGMVAVLPKDELASVAEALVNLTKFRRRVTPVSESVGGPIDVALITKGDGFIWIRRKHYFLPELNPRAVRRLSEA
jgi:hypothetical protein